MSVENVIYKCSDEQVAATYSLHITLCTVYLCTIIYTKMSIIVVLSVNNSLRVMDLKKRKIEY